MHGSCGPTGDICMTTLFSELDWRAMSQEARDLGLNNGVAVPGSVEMVAGWEQRSAEMRKRFPGHLDLRYGPRDRNRIDFLKAGEQAPTLLFIHGGYWQARAKEVFTVVAEGPMTHGINVALIGYTRAADAPLDELAAEFHAGHRARYGLPVTYEEIPDANHFTIMYEMMSPKGRITTLIRQLFERTTG